MRKVILFALVAIAVLPGCKKDKTDNNNPSCELTSANVAGPYKITAIKYKPSATASEIDAYSLYLESCQKDDIYLLNANGVLNYNDAGTQCSPPGTDTTTWSLSGKTLTIDGTAYSVTSFDCKTAVGTLSDVNFPGDQATFTFTKQ